MFVRVAGERVRERRRRCLVVALSPARPRTDVGVPLARRAPWAGGPRAPAGPHGPPPAGAVRGARGAGRAPVGVVRRHRRGAVRAAAADVPRRRAPPAPPTRRARALSRAGLHRVGRRLISPHIPLAAAWFHILPST